MFEHRCWLSKPPAAPADAPRRGSYNNKSVVIGNAEIFFTTMWTHIPAEEAYTIAKIITNAATTDMKAKALPPALGI